MHAPTFVFHVEGGVGAGVRGDGAALRLERGHSQERFAELCGLHRTYVGSIERGEKVVTIVTADKLARALGLSLTGLFAELEREAPDADDG